MLTRQEIIDKITAGESVIFDGLVLNSLDSVPTQEELDKFPAKNKDRSNTNNPIHYYEIVGTLKTGDVLRFNADNSKFVPESAFSNNNGSADYVHNQYISSNIWNISHNLNRFPNVYIEDSSHQQVIGSINYIDSNNIVINFSFSISGKAFLS